MKLMIRLMLLIALPVASTTRAHVYKVQVAIEGEDSREVGDAVKARIGATTRFVITGNLRDSEIFLDLICLPAGQNRYGYFVSDT